MDVNVKEKLVIKADRKAVLLDQFWPIAALFLAAVAAALVIGLGEWNTVMMIAGAYLALVIICVVLWVPKSKAEYTFLPASQYRGTRLMVLQGTQEYEVFDVPPTDFVFGQSWVEKRLGVYHLRVRNTQFNLRGIHDKDAVQAWINANFKVREVRAGKGKKGKKGKK